MTWRGGGFRPEFKDFFVKGPPVHAPGSPDRNFASSSTCMLSLARADRCQVQGSLLPRHVLQVGLHGGSEMSSCLWCEGQCTQTRVLQQQRDSRRISSQCCAKGIRDHHVAHRGALSRAHCVIAAARQAHDTILQTRISRFDVSFVSRIILRKDFVQT